MSVTFGLGSLSHAQGISLLQSEVVHSAVERGVGAGSDSFSVGPGAAKHELHKRLEDKRLGAKVVGVETVDNLTEPQLVAKVRHHFAP